MDDRLMTGQHLHVGEEIRSSNGKVQLTLRADGNIVLQYKRDREIWLCPGILKQEAYRRAVCARMQDDGNLVLLSCSDRRVWAAGTGGHPGAQLVVQDDGNLVILHDGHPIWKSDTSIKREGRVREFLGVLGSELFSWRL